MSVIVKKTEEICRTEDNDSDIVSDNDPYKDSRESIKGEPLSSILTDKELAVLNKPSVSADSKNEILSKQ